MTRKRTIWLWTVLALVFSLISPAAQAAWQCEGRTCGTTLWFCCCLSPEPAQDANCTASEQPGPAGLGCGADCECVLTVSALDLERPVKNLGAASAFSPALVQPALPLLASPPVAQVTRRIEVRGPPPLSPLRGAAGVRGPPSLTVSIGC